MVGGGVETTGGRDQFPGHLHAHQHLAPCFAVVAGGLKNILDGPGGVAVVQEAQDGLPIGRTDGTGAQAGELTVVAFTQLQETVQYVLKAIGYKEIIPHFRPAPPPISISLIDIAYAAGSGYELAFFDLLEKRLASLIETGVDNLQLCSLQPCVKHLRCTKMWTRACDSLREEIVCFIRERLTSTTSERLKCTLK